MRHYVANLDDYKAKVTVIPVRISKL